MIPGKHQKNESNHGHGQTPGAVAWAYHPEYGWLFVRLPPTLTVAAFRKDTSQLALCESFGMVQEVAEGDWLWLARRCASQEWEDCEGEGRTTSEGAGKHALLAAMTWLGVIERPRLDFPVIRKLDVQAIRAKAELLAARPQGHA